jgi:cellulose synthase/poly-beta-1,6-N-acetylglucosamine synthase-like glycosyltransferase
MVDVTLETMFALLYFTFTLLLIPYGYNCFYMIWFSHKYKSPILENVKNHPFVTVQLPIYNEKYVVDRLIDSVCELDWPLDKLEILVLDDSTDETREIIDENTIRANVHPTAVACCFA